MNESAALTVAQAYAALVRGDPDSLAGLLDPGVRWVGAEADPDPQSGCHNREEVIEFLRAWLDYGLTPSLVDVVAAGDRAIGSLAIPGIAALEGTEGDDLRYLLATVRAGRITVIRSFGDRESAVAAAGLAPT